MVESPSPTSGDLILAMTAGFEESGIRYIYLRNHENLPKEVGNDADILVDPSRIADALNLAIQCAKIHGWIYLGCQSHSCRGLYFANLSSSEILHVDLFDRIEWHFLEFADVDALLKRAERNHVVSIPSPAEEAYLNLITRLVYSGLIRENHTTQARALARSDKLPQLKAAFITHLGGKGNQVFNCLEQHNWQSSQNARRLVLEAMFKQYGLLSPLSAIKGFARYVMRLLYKWLHPPGKFIVFEGADGSGKSTVLKEIIPWCSRWNAGRPVYDFHWKPVMLETGQRESKAAVDPRGNEPRNHVFSFCYLIYHILGYWHGWFHHIRPKLVRSHAVIGDRYSYDLFLDPSRFRLDLPDWILKIATKLTPKPDLVVCLIGDANIIHLRKPELSPDEIMAYQNRCHSLALEQQTWIMVDANQTVNEVITKTQQAVLGHFHHE